MRRIEGGREEEGERKRKLTRLRFSFFAIVSKNSRYSLSKFEVIGGLVPGTEESRGKISLSRPNRQWGSFRSTSLPLFSSNLSR